MTQQELKINDARILNVKKGTKTTDSTEYGGYKKFSLLDSVGHTTYSGRSIRRKR
jgi:hypothetical protein